jgi:hypothetical protein
MIDINKEAREYALTKSSTGQFINTHIRDFIAGVNSNHVQAKIIQAQIDVLKEHRNPETMYWLDNSIEKLQKQLKDLENADRND